MDHTIFQTITEELVDKAVTGRPILPEVDKAKIDEMHKMAYVNYRNQRFDEANTFYKILVLAEPRNPVFWKGLGACQQMKKSYENALQCYLCAQAHLEDEDPYIYVHASDCYFALHDTEAALKMLKLAGDLAKKSKDERILHHCKVVEEQWVKDKPKGKK